MQAQNFWQNPMTNLTLNNLLIYLGVLLLLVSAFLLGTLARSSQLWYDRLATRRIRRYGHYRVGDLVTLGNNVHGTVTAFTAVNTVLTRPDQTTITLNNSFVLRSPIYVHPTPGPETNPPEPAEDAPYLPLADLSIFNSAPASPVVAPTLAEEAAATPVLTGVSPAGNIARYTDLSFAGQTLRSDTEQFVIADKSTDQSQARELASFEFLPTDAEEIKRTEMAVADLAERSGAVQVFATPPVRRQIPRLGPRPKLGKYTVRYFSFNQTRP